MKYSVFRKSMQRIALGVVLASGAMAPGMGIAASSSTSLAVVAVAAETAADTRLASELAQSNLYEIQVARLAEQRATDANVKALASAVVRHRLTANAQLKEWAKARGIDVTVPKDSETRSENLSGLRGREFDRQFVQTIGIDEARAVINRLANISESAADTDLRQWAVRTLAKVKQQLAAAEKLQGRASVALN